ncbi:YeiH family protein [Acidaminococcus sp. NSJ-142]|uniref:YeiH family protein n=1 Tax=Acidaminococcus TaxID=904 RepID=UPI001E65D292|nr:MULTISPECIES: YeiH family protein [Acidaminococcus]MCD2435168.1 YeiH family protein [Acidaminococcus hominis]
MGQTKTKGILVCLAIAIPAWICGKLFPVIGGAVIAILLGMVITMLWTDKGNAEPGIKWTSKIILQAAVVLLGFGMDLNVVAATGKQSLPIIVCTISTSLILSYLLHKAMNIPTKISTLIGVGSSICGGSAIAATAPVVHADDEEVAQAISVIFFFNVLAAILFPMLGAALGFSTVSGEGFGIFAGTAVNDTSSVTAAAATWDSMWNLGNATLDKAVTVKLTRTLAIIPITVALSLYYAKKEEDLEIKEGKKKLSISSLVPKFIIYFVLASIVTTIALHMGVDHEVFGPLKTLSKFMIVMAMAAIGLNSNIVKLVKTGGKPILLGGCCWIGITVVSLLLQHMMHLW